MVAPNSREGFNVNVVKREAPEVIRKRFHGRRVTTGTVAKASRKSALFRSRFTRFSGAPHEAPFLGFVGWCEFALCNGRAETGAPNERRFCGRWGGNWAKKLKEREGRSMVFRIG